MNRTICLSLALLGLCTTMICAVGASSSTVASLQTAATTAPAQTGGKQLTPKDTEIRAIYFTGLMAGSAHGKQIAIAWRATGGNAIVFDVKDSDGQVSFPSVQPLARPNRYPPIKDLQTWVDWLHTHGLYAIARQAIFKDERLVKQHPELGIRSRSGGGVWVEHKGAAWVDPSLAAVQDYNIKMALEAAAAGVDEVQFDYVRFPTEGHQKDCLFHYQRTDPTADRSDIISDFLYRAHEALKPTGVHLSIDVFGVDAWSREVDLAAIGQDIVSLSYFCDVLCPMIYPSHFFGNFDGYSDPGDAPEHFIREAMVRFNAMTADTGVVIRPWLQAFAYRTKTYGPDYIRIQVQTSRAQNGDGFMLWNARNDYKTPEAAMPAMLAKPQNYFLGGYPYTPLASLVNASTTSARSK